MTKLTTERLEKRIKNCIEVGNSCVMLPVSVAEALLAFRKAAEKLVRCKGRYHSEQNYRALAALFGVTVPDLPPLPADEAPAQPVIPEQPKTELKIGTSKNAWPYYVAQCPKCGWLGSSADCLGDEESCDCPLCYADADEIDAETAFNVMLDAINKLRASTAQPVSEPYKLDVLNIRAVAALREAVREQWLKSDNFGDKVYWKSMHSIANEIVEAVLTSAPAQESE
ncbi:hypothetical protein PU01_23860 [Hafnia alvei]|nr:hypothetical protein PU01_23860 [Hafnia alvei]